MAAKNPFKVGGGSGRASSSPFKVGGTGLKLGGDAKVKRTNRPEGFGKVVHRAVPKSPASPLTPLSPDLPVDADGLGFLTYKGRVSMQINASVDSEQTVPCSPADVQELKDLGKGAFGVVRKMRHLKLTEETESNVDFAVKEIRDSVDEKLREQLKTDLAVIKSCKCPYIVTYHGFDFSEGSIWIFMELMAASLDQVAASLSLKQLKFEEGVLGKIAHSILEGLLYLWKKHRVMHRDVKPSNILFGYDGSIKLCDFGISKVMEQSISKTRVGCERYLPPERIAPETCQDAYDVRSDVWAFGLTLVELAHLKYPYPEHVYSCMRAIVDDDAPTVPDHYSAEFRSLVGLCLQKDKELRPRYDNESLTEHTFIRKPDYAELDLSEWYRDCMVGAKR